MSFTGGGTVDYKYDPFGRRIYRSGPSGTTIWLYDGANIVEELDGSGTVQATYTQGSGVDEPLAMLRGTTTDYYEADGLGSVTSLTDSAGAIAETYTYDAYGNLTAGGTSLTNPFRYTGREWDQDAGLYYYRARYYVGTGRFLSEDRIGLRGGLNLYEYAFNSPSRFVDSSGNQPELATIPAATAAPAPTLTLITGGAGATTLGSTFGAAVETGSVGGPIGVLVATDLALLAYDVNQSYKLGVAYGWWGDGRISFKSQAQLNKEGTEKAHKACQGGQNHEDDWCDREYQRLLDTCRALKNSACYAQAMEWYAACRAKRPLPPFPYSILKTN